MPMNKDKEQALVQTRPAAPPILAEYIGALSGAGAAANHAARHAAFHSYQSRKSENTLRNQQAALVVWAVFLAAAGALDPLADAAEAWAAGGGLTAEAMMELRRYAKDRKLDLRIVLVGAYCQNEPAAWQGVTWGLVEAFAAWMIKKGYAVTSINNRLSAVRVYARLASKAGMIDPAELTLIAAVSGYNRREIKRLNRKREKTRRGYKKSDAIALSIEQARILKSAHDDDPAGRRDRLMLCLLLDLGLRASEASELRVRDIEGDRLRVYRLKTDTESLLQMTPDLLQALADYRPWLRSDPDERVLAASLNNGQLDLRRNVSTRAIFARVKLLGKKLLNLDDLSPHDLRHTWATHAAKGGNAFALRTAGGWSGIGTAARYVERGEVDNEGIKLDY